MSLADEIRKARESGDFSRFVAAIPYLGFMGISIDVVGDEIISRLAFSEHIVGNHVIRAVHGGAIGALLESVAVFKLLWAAESIKVPKTINITVEYLRTARAVDTFARAEFTRCGRRVANVRSLAWQDDPTRPIAAANAHFLLVPAAVGADAAG